MTDAEIRLWYHLRGHRLLGLKFKRQYPIGEYIVDFICHDHHLIVEVDGSQHLDSARDAERDQWLRASGYLVLRFWNDDVLRDTEAVLEAILQTVRGGDETLSPGPSPLRGEGRNGS